MKAVNAQQRNRAGCSRHRQDEAEHRSGCRRSLRIG